MLRITTLLVSIALFAGACADDGTQTLKAQGEGDQTAPATGEVDPVGELPGAGEPGAPGAPAPDAGGPGRPGEPATPPSEAKPAPGNQPIGSNLSGAGPSEPVRSPDGPRPSADGPWDHEARLESPNTPVTGTAVVSRARSRAAVAIAGATANHRHTYLVTFEQADGSPFSATVCELLTNAEGGGQCSGSVSIPGDARVRWASVMAFDPASNGFRSVASGELRESPPPPS